MKNIRVASQYALLILLPIVLVACQAPPELSLDKKITQTIDKSMSITPMEIYESTPSHFEYKFKEPNMGWDIDADVIIPNDLERFDIICSAIGEAPDFDAVLTSDVISPELAKAPPFVDAEAINFITNMPYSSQMRILEAQQVSRGETYEVTTHTINCAPGFLEFSQPYPDGYGSGVPGISRGNLSTNGIAENCIIDAEESKDMALEFLSHLPLPFDYEVGRTAAFSPGTETTLSKGFYQVQIKQRLDGKPIAVANGSQQLSLGEEIGSKYVPPVTGSWVDVFDFGIKAANLRWLSNEYEVVQKVEKLFHLSAAVEVIEQLLATANQSNSEANYLMASVQRLENGFTIKSIRLEYAATGCDGERVLLTPCWNFEGVSQAMLFRGIRIDAVTGKVLLVSGDEGDGTDG